MFDGGLTWHWWRLKQADNPRLPGGVRGGWRPLSVQPLDILGQVPPSGALPGKARGRIRGGAILSRAQFTGRVSEVKW